MRQPGTRYALFESVEAMPVETPGTVPDPARRFSDFVVYVDESGDHSLAAVDAEYPVFVLALCVFHKRHYSEKIVPAVQKLEFNYFGHDNVVQHESDIRKQKGPFAFLVQRAVRQAFMAQLSAVMDASNCILIACVVDKSRLSKTLGVASNPYNLALSVCLEALRAFLVEKGQDDLKTHVIVECRGKKEDADLELEFRRICDGNNPSGKVLPFDLVFADKRTNLAGLQLADLVARPVGINHLRPAQENQAFALSKSKFYCAGG